MRSSAAPRKSKVNSFEPGDQGRPYPAVCAPSLERGGARGPLPSPLLGLLPAIVRATLGRKLFRADPVPARGDPRGRDGPVTCFAVRPDGHGQDGPASCLLPILHQLATDERGSGLRVLIPHPHARASAAQIAGARRRVRQVPALFRHAVHLRRSQPVPPRGRRCAQRPDLLVATPGRLLDLMNSKAVVRLDQVAPFSCWTKPIACSTWASSTTCGRVIARACRRSDRPCFFSATVPQAIESLGA